MFLVVDKCLTTFRRALPKICTPRLVVFFGGIGLYGVVAFLFGRRTREVGIRLAIGARLRREEQERDRKEMHALWQPFEAHIIARWSA
jgi:hypothetical protein